MAEKPRGVDRVAERLAVHLQRTHSDVSYLASGGMSHVFRARHRELGDRAIKVLQHDLWSTPEEQARFLQEARLLARINDPRILRIWNVEDVPELELAYLELEYVPGRSLAALIEEGSLTPDQRRRIAVQIAGALEIVHEHGMIHRDVKPDNVLLDASMNARLADFGIARELSDETVTRVSTGTPRYKSPEQHLGHPLDERSDLFSLGVVLFELFTGRHPFESRMPDPEEEPPSMRPFTSTIDDDLDDLVRGLLRFRARDRIQSAGDVRRRLEDGAPSGSAATVIEPAVAAPSRPVPWMRLGGAAVILLVIAAVLSLIPWGGDEDGNLAGRGTAGAPVAPGASDEDRHGDAGDPGGAGVDPIGADRPGGDRLEPVSPGDGPGSTPGSPADDSGDARGDGGLPRPATPGSTGRDTGSLRHIGDPVPVEPPDPVNPVEIDRPVDPGSAGAHVDVSGSAPRAIMIRVEILGLPHDSPGLDPLIRVDGSDLGRRRLFSWTARPGDLIRVRPAKHPFQYEPAEAELVVDARSDTLVARFRAER